MNRRPKTGALSSSEAMVPYRRSEDRTSRRSCGKIGAGAGICVLLNLHVTLARCAPEWLAQGYPRCAAFNAGRAEAAGSPPKFTSALSHRFTL